MLYIKDSIICLKDSIAKFRHIFPYSNDPLKMIPLQCSHAYIDLRNCNCTVLEQRLKDVNPSKMM